MTYLIICDKIKRIIKFFIKKIIYIEKIYKTIKRMQNQKIKRDFQEKNESFLLLREDLDDHESLPKEFTVNEGTTTNIKTNIYPITQKALNSKIYQYFVETNPPILNPKQLSRIIFNTLCPETDKSADNQKNHSIIFDGINVIFSSLPNLEGEKSIPDKQDNSKNIIVSLKLIKEVGLEDYESLIHLYQIVFYKAFKSIGLTKFGKKWLNDQDIKQVAIFKIIGGFKPSLVALSNGISLVVYNTYRIDRQNNLYDYLKRGITNPNERNDIVNSLKDMHILTSHLKEQRLIKISNIDWNSTPSQATFEMVNKNSSQNTKISVADYFQQFHNFTVQRDDPLIETIFNINGEQRIDLFPASCLRITGITEAERKDEHLMNELAQATSMPIDVEKQKLDTLISKMKKNPDTNGMFTKWGIEFNDSLDVTGKILNPPKIMFRTRQSDHAEVDIQTNSKICFRNEIKNVGVAVPPRINAAPLIISPLSCIQDIKSLFIPKIIELSREIGISFLNPDLVEIESVSQNSYRKEILDFICKKGTPSFIIVVFPDVNKERYDIVKQLLTVDLGIPSQFVKSTTLFPKNNTTESNNLLNSRIFSNICLKLLYQITAKTGGICYYVSPSTLPLNNTMIVGIHVEKPRSESLGSIICSMTASYDQTLARYYSDTFIISKSQTKSKSGGISASSSLVFNKEKDIFTTIPPDYISDFIRRAVERYIKQRKLQPKRIIVYRSSVCYPLMKKVKQEEVKAITDIIDSSISLVYIIVQPRNNYKFMLIKDNIKNSEGSQNSKETEKVNLDKKSNLSSECNLDCPKAGTVVTEKINTLGIPEFYVVSNEMCNSKEEDIESLSLLEMHQASLTNTERSAIFNTKNRNKKAMITPTKYTIIHHFPVVWDDDKLAMLTHYLTCEYPNWQGAIRIPCPLMLASKLAELTRSSLNSQKSNESLSDCLHFL